MNAPAMPISALIRISALALVAASQVTNANALILMRALMGIAGAFIFPISLAILPTIFSEQERPRAIAIGGAGFVFWLSFVPPLAGSLPPPLPPRPLFFVYLPVPLLPFVLRLLFLPR